MQVSFCTLAQQFPEPLHVSLLHCAGPIDVLLCQDVCHNTVFPALSGEPTSTPYFILHLERGLENTSTDSRFNWTLEHRPSHSNKESRQFFARFCRPPSHRRGSGALVVIAAVSWSRAPAWPWFGTSSRSRDLNRTGHRQLQSQSRGTGCRPHVVSCMFSELGSTAWRT